MVSTSQVSGAVTLEITIKAPPERVFRALTSPEVIPHFIQEFTKITFDARLGGSYEFQGSSDGGTHTARGEITEYDPPRILAYTWQWQEWEAPLTTVRYELEAVEGGTKLSFSQTGFPSEMEQMRSEHEEHWAKDMELLKEHVEAHS